MVVEQSHSYNFQANRLRLNNFDLCVLYLSSFDSSKLRSRVRVIVCWNNVKTSPTENSTAESIRKKNVKETKFRLSLAKPLTKVREYNVIQINSAVRRRWIDELVYTTNDERRTKKSKIKRLMSPKNKINPHR